MPITERPRATDEVIGKFMDFVDRANHLPQKQHSDVENLFMAVQNGESSRLYYVPRGAHDFGIERAAFYHAEQPLPYLVFRNITEGEHLVLKIENNTWLWLKGVSGDETVSGGYMLGSKGLALTLTTGREGSPHYDKKQKSSYPTNNEEEVIEVSLGDKIARGNAALDVSEILQRYFPPQLRADPFGAGVEHDVWATADWMKDFGIEWKKVTTSEVPVFSSPEVAQNQ